MKGNGWRGVCLPLDDNGKFLNQYKWFTFDEIFKRAMAVGSGIKKLAKSVRSDGFYV